MPRLSDRRPKSFTYLIIPAGVSLLLSTCSDTQSSVEPPPVDREAPTLEVTFPSGGGYDETGDSLVDLRVLWSDSGSGVDPASARLRSLVPDDHTGLPDTTNLLNGHWLSQRDPLGMVAHESRARLLRGGVHQLEVSVADLAGNRGADTVALTLPHAALVDSLGDGAPSTVGHVTGIDICRDDGRLYASRGGAIMVADPDQPALIGVFTDPSVGGALTYPLCIPGDSVVYATDRVNRFNRNSSSFLPPVTGTFVSQGFVGSRAASSPRLYVAEWNSWGDVVVVDRVANRRLGTLGIPPAPYQGELIWALAILNDDSKLYVARRSQGMQVVQPSTGRVLPSEIWSLQGINSMRLSADDSRLYTVDEAGYLGEIDTGSDVYLRGLDLGGGVAQVMGLSPSERRIFVTTQDRSPDSPSENVLVDVPGWRVLQTFPRPRSPGATRIDGGVAFHPNGSLLFVGHDTHIDVYLNRE